MYSVFIKYIMKKALGVEFLFLHIVTCFDGV